MKKIISILKKLSFKTYWMIALTVFCVYNYNLALDETRYYKKLWVDELEVDDNITVKGWHEVEGDGHAGDIVISSGEHISKPPFILIEDTHIFTGDNSGKHDGIQIKGSGISSVSTFYNEQVPYGKTYKNWTLDKNRLKHY